MVQFLPNIGPWSGRTLAALVIVLLTWANWQEPERQKASPTTQLAVWRVGGLTDPRQALALDQRLRALDGVTACELNATTQLAVVSYNPEQLSEADVRRALATGGAYVVTRPSLAVAEAGGFVQPSASSPAVYLAAFSRLRNALNVRRLFAPRA